MQLGRFTYVEASRVKQWQRNVGKNVNITRFLLIVFRGKLSKLTRAALLALAKTTIDY